MEYAVKKHIIVYSFLQEEQELYVKKHIIVYRFCSNLCIIEIVQLQRPEHMEIMMKDQYIFPTGTLNLHSTFTRANATGHINVKLN